MVHSEIAVVVTDSRGLYWLDNLLDSQIEIDLFVFSGFPVSQVKALNVGNCFIFDEQPAMVGYMRGLEGFLKNYKYAVVFEDISMASFQVSRFCEKNDLRVLTLYTNPYPSQFENQANVRAVLSHMQSKACRYLSPTQRGLEVAGLEGLDSDKGRVFQPQVLCKLRDRNKSREKFRAYIGQPDDALIIGVFADMTEEFALEVIIDAFNILSKSCGSFADRIRLLMIGTGQESGPLKDLCVRKRISHLTMFLEQDVSSFYWDLMSSLDIAMSPEDLMHTLSSRYSVSPRLFHAACCGVVPMAQESHPCSENLGDLAAYYHAWDPISLSNTFKSAILEIDNDQHHWQKMQQKAGETFYSGGKDSFAGKFLDLIKKHETLSYNNDNDLAEIEEMVKMGLYKESILQLDAYLEPFWSEPSKLSRDQKTALLLKARVHRIERDLDAATVVLGDILAVDPECSEAFVELGYLSLEGQAHDEATVFFKKVFAKEAGNIDAIYGLGLANLQVGLFQESLYWLEKAVLNCSANTQMKSALCNAALKCGDTAIGIECLERVLEMLGEDSAICLALGSLYYSDGQLNKGRKFTELGLQQSPVDSSAGQKHLAK